MTTQFGWFASTCAAGLYGGMTAGGLLAIVRGDVTEPTVLIGLPVLLALGALGGWWVARRTAVWLVPQRANRARLFAVIGAVTLPVALCTGQLKASDTLFGAVVLLPGLITGAAYLYLARRVRRHGRTAARSEPPAHA